MSEIFEYFFDAYFHQDWRGDCSSSVEVIENFIKDEPAESKAELKQAFKELLKNDNLPQDTINKLGGNFKPESEGMTVTEWINIVLDLIVD